MTNLRIRLIRRRSPAIAATCDVAAGMLRIALALGADARFRRPMAVAVSGRLLASTALSLLSVPAAFSLLSDFELWTNRQFGSGQDSNAAAMAR